MNDLIKRSDAIKAIWKKLQEWDCYDCEDFRRGLYEAHDILEALPSAENSNAKTQNSNQETQKSNGDLIKRADAIEAVCDKCPISFKEKCEWKDNGHCSMKVALSALPSAEAVHKPDYSYEADMVKRLRQAVAVQGCDGCRYNTRIPQKQCLRCKRYWRDSYERKGGEDK